MNDLTAHDALAREIADRHFGGGFSPSRERSRESLYSDVRAACLEYGETREAQARQDERRCCALVCEMYARHVRDKKLAAVALELAQSILGLGQTKEA